MKYSNFKKAELLLIIENLQRDLENFKNIKPGNIEAISESMPHYAGEITETREFYEEVIEGVQDGIWVTDENDIIYFVNAAMAAIAGIPKEQIRGKNVLHDFPPETTREIVPYYNQARKDKKPVWYDIKVHTPSGRDTWQNGWIIPKYKNNIFKGIICTIRDGTERKLAEKELIESLNREQLLGDIVRNTSIGIAIGYPDGRLGMCNAAYQKITGYSETELKTIDWNYVLTPPEWAEAETLKLAELNRLKQSVLYEKEYIRKDGSRVPIELLVHPQFDDNGEVECYFAFVTDITERKLTEQRIIKSKETAELYLDMAGSMIVSVDLNGEILLINQKGLEILEYQNSSELVGKNWLETCIPKDIIPEIKLVLNRILTGGNKFEEYYENEVITKKGVRKLISWYNSCIKDDEGRPQYLLSSGNDITEIKKSNLKLIESETRYHELVNIINSGVVIYKVINDGKSVSDFIIQDFNRLSLSLKKLKKEDVIGKTLKEISPEIADSGLIEVFREVWKTGKPAFYPAKEFVNEDYSSYFENRIFRLPSHEIVAVYDDVTERENSAAQIKESQERFDLAMKASKDGIFDWNLVTNEIYYSPGWKSMLGYEYDEVPNEFSFWENNTNPEDDKKSRELHQELLNNQRDRIEIEFRMKHKNGNWVNILSRAEGIFDKNGRAVRMVGTHTDVTERKVAENKLKTSLEEKEVLLRELYHRTKNNMQVISSMLGLKAAYSSNQQLTEIFKDIENKILSMALVHKKLYESEDLSHINLKEYLEDLVLQLNESMTLTSTGIDISLTGENIQVILDIAIPFGLIVNEIIANAIKYAFKGIENGRIDIDLKLQNDEEIILNISDNGHGLSKDFDILKDGGFGLKTVKKLVETQLKGKLTIINCNGLNCKIMIKKDIYEERI